MNKLMAKIAGFFISKKLKLEEGKMENWKGWYKSKTVWAGVVAVLVSAYNQASTSFGLPPVPEWIYTLLGAVGVYGRVTATTTITK